MIIDNGARKPLIIHGVFDGLAGLSGGVLSFTPNRIGRPPLLARGAVLDGEPVRLLSVQLGEDGRSMTARFEAL
jgi:hypothetical protein